MKLIKIPILLSIIFYNLLSDDLNRYEGSFGYLSKLSLHIKYNNSQEALKIIVNDMARSINSKFNLISYLDEKKLLGDFKNNKIQIMATNPEVYLKNYDFIDLNTRRYFQLSDAKNIKLDSLYLIVNKDKNINKISDLNNKKIILKNDEFLSNIFLDYQFLKNNINSENITYMDKYNTILLKIFFGDYDACIIPSYVYNTILELNPSIKSKIEILEMSPKIFSSTILFLSKNNNEKDIAILEKGIADFKLSKEKDEIFNLLKVNDMYFLEDDEMSVLRNFYIDYKRLKEK